MKVAIIGAGRVGSLIARLLNDCGDYTVTLFDCNEDTLHSLNGGGLENLVQVHAEDSEALEKAVTGQQVVVCAGPSHLAPTVASAAREIGAHYFDLCEASKAASLVKEISDGAEKTFLPQCGVSPGLISIVTRRLAAKFENDIDVCVRVGALPRYPANRLKYGLTWDTDGLFSEYTEPCDALHDGKPVQIPPLSDLESISLDGQDFEAFTTANGMGSLCDSLIGRVRNLRFKTIRYPGHLDKLLMLMDDFGMRKRADLFRMIMENGLPIIDNDLLIFFITVSGLRNGRRAQESYVRRIYVQELASGPYGALQSTSAAATCAGIDLVASGRLATPGHVRQEDIDYDTFMGNRFMRSIKMN